jgi:hypothetical protein
MSKSLNAPLACLIGIAALIGTLTLAGCATVPMASMEQDSAAKGFATPPDLSRIYLYRNKSFGGAIPLTVSLDGKTMGQTGPNTYFVWDVSPGEHTVTSYSEAWPRLLRVAGGGKGTVVGAISATGGRRGHRPVRRSGVQAGSVGSVTLSAKPLKSEFPLTFPLSHPPDN